MPDFTRYVQGKLGSLPLRPEREAEIVEEIASHLKVAFEEIHRQGMPEEESLAKAERPFLPWDNMRKQIIASEGTITAEAIRIQWGIDDYLIARRRDVGGWLVGFVADLWQDLRFALRSLRRLPAFSIPSILTLALAIGATTAIFSLVNGILLRPLDYEDPDSIVTLQFVPANLTAQEAYAAMDARDRRHFRYNVSYPNFEQWHRSTTDVFEYIAAYDDEWSYKVGFGDGSELLPGAWVSASLFSLLRVKPLIGRAFTEDEDAPGSSRVVILGYKLWQRKFAGSEDIIGQILHVNEKPHTIVGVMSSGFGFPGPDTDFWRPMADASRGMGSTNYQVVGRLSPEVSLEQADVILSERAVTKLGRDGSEEQWAGGLRSLHDYIVGDIRRLLLVFLAAVTAVLLIACVNVVNLMLTQAVGRDKEYIVRAALGAGRRRLVQQLLTESMLMSLLSGFLGLGLAVFLTRALLRISPTSIPRQELVGIDTTVLIFFFAVSIIVGLTIGILPALRVSRTNLAAGLNNSARGLSGSIRQYSMRNSLVVVQLGMALVLLVCSGLLLKSFSGMLAKERGFDPQNVLTFETSLPRSRYQTFEDYVRFYDELLEGVRAMPGINSVAIAVYLPATGSFHSMSFDAPQYEHKLDEELVAEFKEVSPDYFATLGIRLVEGRLFNERDDIGTAPTVIINREMVRKYWPDGNAIGSMLNLDTMEEDKQTVTVIGVVDDVLLRAGGRARGDEENFQIYVPFAAWERARNMDVLASTSIRPSEIVPSIRRLIGSMDPEVVLYGFGTVEDLLSARVAEPRFRTLLIGILGLVALILAVVGVYGVMAFSVTQRTREMGIRLAIGAQGKRIMQEVFVRGLVLTLFGLGIGTVGAWVATMLLESYLYEIDAHDPATIALSLLVLAVSALLACILPARRAARVDPLIALRAE